MDFSNLLKRKKEDKDFFIALLLKPYSVGTILFERIGTNLSILATKEEDTEKEIDHLTSQELLEVSDRVISAVETSMPPGEAFSKTIFSVPYTWVEEGKIKKEDLLKLKKNCDELQLTPIGYIVSIEAIVHYLQEKEGAPVTSIFIELAKNTVFVYLVKGSSIVEVKSATIEESIIKTVEQILKTIEAVHTLPTKIVLLAYQGVEQAQQEFLSYPWTKELPFLHVPQVVILEKGFENEAIIKGVASQMGSEVGDAVVAHRVRETSAALEEEDVSTAAPEELATAASLGFFKDKDVAIEEAVPEESVNNEDNIQEESNIVSVSPPSGLSENDMVEEGEGEREIAIHNYNEGTGKKMMGGFSLPHVSMPSMSIFKARGISSVPIGFILLPIILIVLAGVGVFFYYSNFLKAEVVLFSDKKVFNENESVIFSTKEPTSFEDKTVNIAIVSEEVNGEASKNTTGKKETGEKAKGEVTIFNKTEDKKTFAKGTTLVGPNDLEFVLSDEVNIASTSSFSTNFANAKVKIEAAEFGKEYNIPSNTNFTLEEFPTSSFFAKNDQAFSGGTKTEIKVVSEKDLTALEETITKDLTDQAIEQARSAVGGEETVIGTPLSSEFVEKNFDKKANQEADKVALDASVKFDLGTYKKTEIGEFIKGLAGGNIPSEYLLQEEESTIELTDIEIEDEDSISANLVIDANYLPNLNTDEVGKTVKGKSIGSAEKSLKDMAGISDATIVFRNKIPFLPQFLPFNAKNITVEIRTES